MGDVEMNPIGNATSHEATITSSSEPKKREEKNDPLQRRLENARFLIEAAFATDRVQLVVFWIYAIQLTILIEIIRYADNNKYKDYDMEVVCVGGIYATIAVVLAVYRDLESAFFYISRFFIIRDKNYTWMNFFALFFEICLVFLQVVALLYVVPQQETITEIVMNCTAITSVCFLDDEFFKKFEYHVKVDENFKPDAEIIEFAHKSELRRVCKRYLPILAGVAFYLTIVFWALAWDDHCLRFVCE